MLRTLTLAAALLALACGNRGKLSNVGSGAVFDRSDLTFAPAYVGSQRIETLTLTSQTASSQSLSVEVSAPFSVLDAPHELAGGSALQLQVVFGPETAGAVEATLALTVDGTRREVTLHAVGLEPLACAPAADPCQPTRFNPDTGLCDTSVLPDGQACAAPSQCVVGGVCSSGVCLGTGNTCDDQNFCTIDACGSEGGCAHLDGSWQCPKPSNPCQVPSCDPKLGCGVTEAPDGTSCGPSDCDFASVCISGACQQRAVPEGGACGDDSPCRAKGSCLQHKCVLPDATPLTMAWSYEPPAGVQWLAFKGISDPQGQLYWIECTELPINSIAYKCEAVSHTRTNFERFRTALTSTRYQPISYGSDRQLLSGTHFIFEAFNNEVTSISSSTGAQEWTVALDTVVATGTADVANQFQVSGFAADALGNVTTTVRRWNRTATTVTAVDSALVVLDARNGAVKRKQFIAGETLSFVLSPLGDAYVSMSSAQGSSLRAIDPSGATRWNVANVYNQPHALWNGELLMRDGFVRSPATGAVLPGAPSYSSSSSPALMTSGFRYEVTGPCCDTCDCAYVDTGIIRGSVSGQTEPLFTRLLTLGFMETTDAQLTSQLDALVANGDNGTHPPALHAVTMTGDDRFSCVVPDPPMLDPPAYSRTWDSTALLDDLWVVRRSYSCNVCDFGERHELAAFKVPGVKPAKTGWTARGGGPSGNLGGW